MHELRNGMMTWQDCTRLVIGVFAERKMHLLVTFCWTPYFSRHERDSKSSKITHSHSSARVF